VRFVAVGVVFGTRFDKRWSVSVPVEDRAEIEPVRVVVLLSSVGGASVKELDLLGSNSPWALLAVQDEDAVEQKLVSARVVSLMSRDGQRESCWIGVPTLTDTPYERVSFVPSTSRGCMFRYMGGIEQSAVATEMKEEAQINAMVNIAADE
jgi:hypothetical protein